MSKSTRTPDIRQGLDEAPPWPEHSLGDIPGQSKNLRFILALDRLHEVELPAIGFSWLGNRWVGLCPSCGGIGEVRVHPDRIGHVCVGGTCTLQEIRAAVDERVARWQLADLELTLDDPDLVHAAGLRARVDWGDAA